MNKQETLLQKLNGVDQKVRELRVKWIFFVQVFGNDERVALLNSTASAFFRVAEDAMLHDILLSISRLVDPPKSAGKETLSLKNILNDIDDEPFKAKVAERMFCLEKATASIKCWRDKALAHNDLSQSLSGIALPDIQVHDLASAIALVEQIVNLLSQHLGKPTVLYEYMVTSLENGDALLARLKLGEEVFRECPSKLRSVCDWLHNTKPKSAVCAKE